MLPDADKPAASSDVLRWLAQAGRSATRPPPPPPPPPEVGRYKPGKPLGAGGMGVVYQAYDPQLQRYVALKLLRVVADDPEERTRQDQRMLLEARAMARLEHPNVVRVYDSGRYGGDDDDLGGVYIAMELVNGPTLQQWRRAPGRGWREILEMFLQAGRGLASAHAEGLIHRDFKPENVLISKDLAKVTDFGLVSDTAGMVTLESQEDAGGSADTLVERQRLTRQSQTLGTPQYMAPEQHERADVDARADQFSFCLALYEALFRLDVQVEGPRRVNGWRVDPPRGSPVPPALIAVLRRGLQERPEMRWPSLDELLVELAAAADPGTERAVVRPPSGGSHAGRPRRMLWLSSLVTGALAGSAVLVARGWQPAGGCRIEVSPAARTYTDPFNINGSCSCTAQTPDCHQLYQGRVRSVQGFRADLEFKKVTSGPPRQNIRYWVLRGAEAPVCTHLDDYPDATGGRWPEHWDTLTVDNVPVWTSEAEFAAAPEGSRQTLFLATGDGAGDTEARTWYQPRAITFTKVCD